MIGLFSIMSVLEPPETQNIACTVDSVLIEGRWALKEILFIFTVNVKKKIYFCTK